MANVGSVTNHFITAQEGFTTTTSGSVASGAATVGLNSVAGYTNGAAAAFVIEPTTPSKKQVFTGIIDTAGVQVTGVVWTEGTNTSHAAGVTVVDYTTATHQAALTKGLLVEHNQDGTHADILLDKIYPVGSIYTNASVATNPATLLGFGTWEAFGSGRVLVGVDASQTEFDTLGETGGAKTHTLTTAEMPSHTHSSGAGNGSVGVRATAGSVEAGTHVNRGTVDNASTGTGSAGSGNAHNNLQPYITVYMWRRSA
jgi:hypothetical protein